MFLRRMIRRDSCPQFTTDGLPKFVPSLIALSLKHDGFSSRHRIHIDSSYRKEPSGKQCSGDCPVIICDLQRLLTINNRYDLYQFLRSLTISERFHDEVKRLLGEHEKFAFPQVLTLVDMYSWNQKKEGVDMMQRYAEDSYPKKLASHGNFVPHKMVCENLNEPTRVLTKLLEMASRRSHLKAVVLTQAELLLNRVISRGSRSVVDKVNQYLVHECCPELRGPLLCSSWISFYLSPYEGDQIRAANILRTNEKDMLPHLDLTLSSFAQHLLDGRQLNRYYVLLQVFSKRSHRSKTKDLLDKLFCYFCKS